MSTARFSALASSIQSLGAQLESLRQSDTIITQYDRVARAAEELQSVVQAPLQQWRALTAAGIPCPAEISWIVSSASDLEASLSPPVMDLERISGAVESARRQQRTNLSLLQSATREAWAAEVDRALRSIPALDQLKLLELVDKQRAGELREVRTQIELLRDVPPRDREMCSQLERWHARAIELSNEMEDVPDEVRHFLRGVQSGFPLGSLSETIVSWLREHDQLDAYMIRPRSSFSS